MKVLSWNIQDGGGERLPAILDALRAEGPDLVALQECVGWDQGSALADAARAIGVSADERHCLLGRAKPRPSGRRYHLVLLSRWPLDLLAMDDAPGLAHGLLKARVGETLTVLVAHLGWRDEDERVVEVRHLLRQFSPPRVAREDALLLGDLNSLSRRDPYSPELAEALSGAGIVKYGAPPRFDVTDRLGEAGWVDCLRSSAPSPASWATVSCGGVALRPDYVLASPKMAARLSAAGALRREGSDHRPVYAAFACLPRRSAIRRPRERNCPPQAAMAECDGHGTPT